MISSIISRLVLLLFGNLYPAYASYKAVRTKNVKEYVKWMMYWIVFALFTCIETFTDVFLSWFPFYYEIKIIVVIWLLSPATKGSSILYRKFVHPTLSSKEQEIDEYITKAKEQSYKQVLDLGSRGVSAIMQTAIKSINHIPPAIVSSISDPCLSANQEKVDGVTRSFTSEAIAEVTLYSDDDDEIMLPVKKEKKSNKSKAVGKKSKGVGRPRKNAKEIKTESVDGTDSSLE